MSKLYSGLKVLAIGAFPTTAQSALAGAITVIDDFVDQTPAPAIPEPTALLAMGVGLATIIYAVRRRRQR